MAVHVICIDGNRIETVGDIKSSIEEKVRLEVETLDGTLHKIVEWQKTNQEVQFFNILDGTYDLVKAYAKTRNSTPIRCGFPNKNGEFVFADYYLSLVGENNKGFMHDGTYYKNGMVVRFQKLLPDAEDEATEVVENEQGSLLS